MTYSVYTLSDPRTGHVRYVGFTGLALTERLRSHAKERWAEAKFNWILSLRSQGRRPIIEALEECPDKRSAMTAEIEWISMLRHLGCDLMNVSDGGSLPVMTAETKAKISASHKGKVKTPEHLRKISEALKGHGISEEGRAKMRAAKLGTKWSAARRAACKRIGRPHTAESIAKMRETKRRKALG